MDKVQKYNSFNTNTPSSESYRNYAYIRLLRSLFLALFVLNNISICNITCNEQELNAEMQRKDNLIENCLFESFLI